MRCGAIASFIFAQSFRHGAFGYFVRLSSPRLFPLRTRKTKSLFASPMQKLRLPLLSPWNAVTQTNVQVALKKMVDSSSDLFVGYTATSSTDVHSNNEWHWGCFVPAFGVDCRIKIELQIDQLDESLMLTMQGSQHQTEFGWICTKLYEFKLDRLVDGLRQAVVQRYNERPADPGVEATSSAWTGPLATAFERILVDDIPTILEHLASKGFAVIDTNYSTTDASSFSLSTTAAQQERLSSYLHETTGQGDSVRTDRVHFLSRDDAFKCCVQSHYDFLMGIANCFNERQDHAVIPSSKFMQAIAPATLNKPLTIPRTLQFAEYGPGDFYKAHSDNSLTGEFTMDHYPIRANFRAYTCILYMTDNDWELERDGGALRLYHGSQRFQTLGEATDNVDNFIDISPVNGRLLMFDSHLIHSVQTVMSSKRRRALTLWINRPNNSGVKGEVYY